MPEVTRWVVGSHLCAIAPGGVALVAGESRAVVERLWDRLRDGSDLAGLLQVVAAEYAADLMKMPTFAVVIHGERRVHVALRGPVRFLASTSEEEIDISAADVVTWVERNLGQIHGYRLIVEETQAESLPMRDGLVRVGAVYHGAAEASEPRKTANETVNLPTVAPPMAAEQPLDALSTGRRGISAPQTESAPPQIGHSTDETDEPPVEESPRYAQASESTVAPELTLIPEAAAVEPEEELSETNETEPDSDGGLSPQARYYAHHWEATQAINVEEAAVREVQDDDRDPFDAPPIQPSVTEVKEPVPEPEPVPVSEPVMESPEESGDRFFIDSVPRPGAALSSASVPLVPSSSSHPEPPEAPASVVLGDHDGYTVASSQLAMLRNSRANVNPPAPPTPPPSADHVLAGFCQQGHPSPPHAPHCRVCGQPLTDRTGMVPRPPLGHLRVSNGIVVPLISDIVIGRAPRSVPEPGRPAPQLVPVPSPEQQISRTHCEIRIDGWDIRIRDRKSNNGTFLLRPGESPVRIDEQTPTILRMGDVLDLGENVTLTLESD